MIITKFVCTGHPPIATMMFDDLNYNLTSIRLIELGESFGLNVHRISQHTIKVEKE